MLKHIVQSTSHGVPGDGGRAIQQKDEILIFFIIQERLKNSERIVGNGDDTKPASPSFYVLFHKSFDPPQYTVHNQAIWQYILDFQCSQFPQTGAGDASDEVNGIVQPNG